MDDVELAELVGRIGALYGKRGLSPPYHLRAAARHWLGISHDEIVAVIENHFADHRRLYTLDSGDSYFHMIEAAIRKAWEAKHPPRDHVEDEPARPRRKRGVRQVYAAGGYADAIVDSGEDGDAVGEDAET
jgi:hypothetical protein